MNEAKKRTLTMKKSYEKSHEATCSFFLIKAYAVHHLEVYRFIIQAFPFLYEDVSQSLMKGYLYLYKGVSYLYLKGIIITMEYHIFNQRILRVILKYQIYYHSVSLSHQSRILLL